MKTVRHNGPLQRHAGTIHRLGRGRRTGIALAVIYILCAVTPVFKFGPIKFGEPITFALCIWFALKRPNSPQTLVGRGLVRVIVIFLTVCALGIVANMSDMYDLQGFGGELLKKPGWIGVARIGQLGICCLLTETLVRLFGSGRISLSSFARTYTYVAIAMAIASTLATLTLRFAGFAPLGFAYITSSGGARACGLFGEGGPLGLYLGTAFVVDVCLLTRDKWIYRWGRAAVFLSAIAAAESKAGTMFLAGSLVLWIRHSGIPARLRRAISWGLGVPVVLVTVFFIAKPLLDNVADARAMVYETAINDPTDYNYMAGRVVGSIIVPRMIRDKPLLGVGIGNYGLFRNDPKYLEGLPAIEVWDLNGLGLLGMAAEIGVPLLLFFVGMLYMVYHRSRRAGRACVVAAAPLLAFIFGVQVTFLYPWLLLGLAIAWCDAVIHERQLVARRSPIKSNAPSRIHASN